MDADPRDALIQQLQAENAALRAEVQSLHEVVKKMTDRLEALEREAHRQAAPFRRKDKDKKPPDQHKKPGRPKGHPPAFRPPPPQVDDDIEMRLDACPQCGGAITAVQRCEQYIEDIPPVRPRVTKLTTYVGTCQCCGEVRSTHPLQVSTATGAAGTHLGARALAFAAWLSKRLGMTTRSVCKLLKNLFGLGLSPGGLTQALDRVADKLQPSFDQLIDDLRSRSAVWADETGWWVREPKWLWAFTSHHETVYHIDGSRGRDVVLDMLGESFAGVLTSDCLAAYEKLPYRMQKCYFHHLKAIRQAYENDPSDYLVQLRALLKAAIFLHGQRTALALSEWTEKRQHLEDRADELLARTIPPAGAAKVAERIRKRRQWLFTFLDDPLLEATNNRAERSLRPAVIARKLSCGNKTDRGKQTWEILTSLAVTSDQRGRDFIESIRPQLALTPASGR